MSKELDYYMGLDYKVIIQSDSEDGGYVASFPDLPGCITQADTLSELESMIEDAKRCWFKAAIEDGYEIKLPSQATRSFKLRMPRTLYATLSVNAENEGVSMNMYIVSLLSKETV